MESKVSLNKIIYLYLALPVIIFMLTWIRPSIGIPAAMIVCFALFFAIKSIDQANKIVLSQKAILITIAIAFIWCFFAGQGGFWYQSTDHAFRNAVFKDLVYRPWPVVFEEHDVLLNYYVGYWLVPALFGKFFHFMTQSTAGAWLVAKVALLLWSTLSITLCFLLLANVLHCNNSKRFFTAILLFIFFSGLDILGIYLLNKKADLHLEWWCPGYQYSAFTVCLFWVYNQAIPAWIATLLLLADRKIENFAFCGLCIFISSPIPLIGLFPIYVVVGIQELMKSKEKLVVIRKIFSLQNLIACLIIFPICFIYFSDNAAVSMKGVRGINAPGIQTASIQTNIAVTSPKMTNVPKVERPAVKFIKESIKMLIFFMVEFGIYLFLVLKKQKKSLLFWIVALELIVIPFIHIGTSHDFCMRASIPPLVVLMTMVFDDFYYSYAKKSLKFTLYCIVLAFAVLTPGKEFYRGVFEIYKHKQFEDNRLYSIEDMISSQRTRNNFLSYDYSYSLFCKYLAKKSR